jgi:hypothetical protein
MKYLLTLILLIAPISLSAQSTTPDGCYVKAGETECYGEAITCSKTESNMQKFGVPTGALCDSLHLSESREGLAQSYISYLETVLRWSHRKTAQYKQAFCTGKLNKKTLLKCRRLSIITD